MGSVESTTREAAEQRVALDAARAAKIVTSGPVETTLLMRTKKSLVVRLRGPGDRVVIAKRSSRNRSEAEARVYDEVLALLPEGHLRLLGRALEGDRAWLFLDDGGDTALDTRDPGMRLALGRLLGRNARRSSAAPLPGFLPRYTSEYFRGALEAGRRSLRATQAAATDAQVSAVAAQGIGQLARIDALWPTIASVFDGSELLCHADVVAKNVRFRAVGGGEPEPVLLDWELAGIGPLAVDLGCLPMSGSNDPLIVGCSREFGASPDALMKWAGLGRLLRMVHAIQWAALDLESTPTSRGLQLIGSYRGQLDRAIGQIWEGRQRDAIA